MSDINGRLDGLKSLIQTPEFLEGKGLSNEVNIRIFCYDAEQELTVKHFINQIITDQSIGCNLIEWDLYKLFLKACEEIDILDAIPEMENTDGSSYLLEQLHSTIGEEDFIKIMKSHDYGKGDVLLLTGVGEVFPFMRVHSLLEALQPHFSDIPILVMYPGVFDKHHLRLFNRLKPNDYYRAFNVI